MRWITLALMSVVLLSSESMARMTDDDAATTDEHAYFGFAFNYKYDQPSMQLGVCAVRPDGPAKVAGLRTEDLIVAIDRRTDFTNSYEVLTYVYAKRPADKLELTVIRGGNELTLSIVGGEATDEQKAVMRRNLEYAEREADRH